MKKGIHNYSEIGKLNRVLLHRPGREVEALTPATMERLLFDDVPYLKEAQKEHDQFAKVLKDNGVEVIYYEKETAKALKETAVREEFVSNMIELSFIESEGMKQAIRSFLMSLEPEKMVEEIISGVRRDDLGEVKTGSLSDLAQTDYPFVMDPMPNLYFTRDPGACIGDGINIHHMHTPARRRESLLLKYMFEHDPDFATEGNKQFYDIYDDYSVEGGDVLVLSKDMVAIGYSERTTIAGIENFAENLLKNSGFKKVIVFDIPKCRAFMHLDTVFTMVDYDKFTIHPEIEGPLSVYELTLGKDGKLEFDTLVGDLDKLLAKELKLPSVELIRCGGGDIIAAQRVQWNDGSNTLTIAPGVVVVYDRNTVTNKKLEEYGLRLIKIRGSELVRGRGGPRCMSMPFEREEI